MKLLISCANSPIFRRVVFLAYVAAVLGATLAPLSGDAYNVISGFDKLVHVALFGGVALLLCWNLNSVGLATMSGVLVFTTLFAAAIEVIQGRLWYRSGDFWDLLAGALGAMLGIIAAWIAARVWTQASVTQG
jgi:glycopeptide antibiotics resistance protein